MRQPGGNAPEHPVAKGAATLAADDDQVRVDPVRFTRVAVATGARSLGTM
jgi:hypothetical protein